MELPAAEYLYTLAILAVTFAAVSVLVTLLRQITGGKLTRVDVHLLAAVVAPLFVITICAMLPPAIALFHPPPELLWAIASAVAAALFAVVIGSVQWERRKFREAGGLLAAAPFPALWFSVLMLLANATAIPIQGIGLHAAAVTLALAIVMLAFVRRIAAFGNGKSDGEWDLKDG